MFINTHVLALASKHNRIMWQENHEQLAFCVEFYEAKKNQNTIRLFQRYKGNQQKTREDEIVGCAVARLQKKNIK